MRPPSVNDLALSIADVGLPHPLLVIAARAAIAAGDPDSAADEAQRLRRSLLGPAINATGVLLHTNLGRAPLGLEAGRGGPVRFSNLEFDISTGRRGSRASHASLLLATLTGAEAALVVNNCAAAVTLVLAALARGRGVAVSRGELVEIGGGFRVPEVMEQSGARLVEVGTTNRTRVADYRAAAERDDVALLLKVHPSNYRITGFTEQADVADLAKIGPPVVSDLGSGLLDERCPWLGARPDWLAGEPGARQTLAAGAALVTFSGDKLMGGPQAGIICGAGRPGGRLRSPSADASLPARLAGARRVAVGGDGLPAPRRRRHPVLAHGPREGRRTGRTCRGAGRWQAGAHHSDRRAPAPCRDRRFPRPASSSTVTTRLPCGRSTRR